MFSRLRSFHSKMESIKRMAQLEIHAEYAEWNLKKQTKKTKKKCTSKHALSLLTFTSPLRVTMMKCTEETNKKNLFLAMWLWSQPEQAGTGSDTWSPKLNRNPAWRHLLLQDHIWYVVHIFPLFLHYWLTVSGWLIGLVIKTMTEKRMKRQVQKQHLLVYVWLVSL